jgi:uncharacterized membrane protein
MADLEPSPESGSPEELVEMGRLKGLSDGVFAIALTLLVLDLRIPDVLTGDLPTKLNELVPKALIYLISFVVIGGAWGSHQRMIGQIQRGDGLLVWFNLFSLLFVTLVPASAALLGRFPDAFVAVTCFAANVVLIQLTALWMWRHASQSGLVNPSLDPRVVVIIGRRLIMSAIVFGLSIPLALLNTLVSYVLWIGMFVLLFTTDWLSWQLALKTQQVQIPLDGATRARIHVQQEAGQLDIGVNATTRDLIQGVFGGGLDSEISRMGDVLNVRLANLGRRGFMSFWYPWAWGKANVLDWTFGLGNQIPIVLDIEIVASQATLELEALQITELNMKTSVSSALIALPANAGQTAVNVKASTASLIIRVPPDVAAFIHTSEANATTEIATTEIDLNRFPMIEKGLEFRSINYETAANRVDIRLDVATSSVEIV